jgi:hypothetical protein
MFLPAFHLQVLSMSKPNFLILEELYFRGTGFHCQSESIYRENKHVRGNFGCRLGFEAHNC